MKILHLCKLGYDGAGNAAFRHSEALERAGYDSKLMVLKGTPKEIILGINSKDKFKEFITILSGLVFRRLNSRDGDNMKSV